MCHRWLFKLMACGHPELDLHIIRCALVDAAWPLRCRGIWYSDAHQIRPYTPGDGACTTCRERADRQAVADQWVRATGGMVNHAAAFAFRKARTHLMSLDFVKVEHLRRVQDALVKGYVDEGKVMDVDAALMAFGYDIPHPAPAEPNNWGGENNHGEQAQAGRADSPTVNLGSKLDELDEFFREAEGESVHVKHESFESEEMPFYMEM
ncbi:hypothetical protein F5Y05DRAFT_410298 [Hypoxylon sp. FL0543]|nr:hypothetical protein F5Y05DRAFT_410298 [Hypoxylon sp. FL0543]